MWKKYCYNSFRQISPCPFHHYHHHHKHARFLSSLKKSLNNPIPVITIPKYLKDNLGNAIYKEHVKVKESKSKWNQAGSKLNMAKHANKLIISWSGDSKLNHYYGYRYRSDQVPLISKQFFKQISIGHRMTFHSFDTNPSLMECISSNKQMSFDALGIEPDLIQSIYRVVGRGSVVTPSSIQFGVIPFILQQKNVVFSAETGSGKTIAYLAPIIQLINRHKKLFDQRNDRTRSPLGLVVLPSRELTEQVGYVAKELALGTNVGVATMIGGLPKSISHTGLDLVVTTIGMVESHLNRGIYRLNQLNHIVLDEADTLLDDTFSYQVVDLLESLNLQSKTNNSFVDDKEHEKSEEEAIPLIGSQLICCSATMPPTLESTVGGMLDLNEDVEKVTTDSLHRLHQSVKHIFYRIHKHDKNLKLMELLKEHKQKPTIVFANRANAVDWLYHFLNENDIRCVKLSKRMSEEDRYNAFQQFQQGECDLLVATDLGSRGLDTVRVQHVINYDCPHYTADYFHRAGRTGRLGSRGTGLVSTLVAFKLDVYMLIELEKALRLGEQVPTLNANIRSQINQRRADKFDKLQRNQQ